MGNGQTGKTSGSTLNRASQSWTPRPRRAKMVGEFVPALMRPAFEKFGFSASSLLTDWEAIAGREIASYTAPERMKWPRKTPENKEDAAPKAATLVLRVAGARALEVEQMRPRLIERINAAFGYRAVSEIRIVQAPLPKAGTAVCQAPKHRIAAETAPIDHLPDGPLKDAFARMAAGLKARQNQAHGGAS